MTVTQAQAKSWAELACQNLAMEFPHSSHHVVSGPGESSRPRVLHPSFHGSFDWHSAVHMHWLLISLLTSHPHAIDPTEVVSRLTADLNRDRLSVEADYLRAHPGFERPYGWAWVLALHAAAVQCPHPAAESWAAALAATTTPATTALAADWLATTLPVRYGMHANSAFSCLLVRHAAAVLELPELAERVDAAARRWFEPDRSAPWHIEPSAYDFLSPTLTEAYLMAQVLGDDFAAWWSSFAADPHGPDSLRPVAVLDPHDGQQVHLFGLGLSRAWQLTGLDAALRPTDPETSDRLAAVAGENLDYGLTATEAAGEFMSDHWLASFAYLALQRPF